MKDGLRNAQELIGLAVISVSEGKRVGEIARLLVHRASRRVTRVEVTGGTFSHARYLRFDQIQTLGGEAAMIESESVLERELRSEELRELDTSLSGRPVMSRQGERLGELTDYDLDTTSGKIATYRFQTGGGGLSRLVPFSRHETVDVPDAMVITLGTDALIVVDGAAAAAEPTPAERPGC